MAAAPATAMPIPTHCLRLGLSPRNHPASSATQSGWVETSADDAAILVRSIDAIQDAKWAARKTPAVPVMIQSGGVSVRRSLHSPRNVRIAATSTTEIASRQKEMTSGGAAEKRVSGAAQLIASTETNRTRNGDAPGVSVSAGIDPRPGINP